MKILSLLLLVVPSLLFAEGLPLNESRTKYEGPHHLVKLNKDQLEEVTVVGTLTLTRDQWQEARAKNPATPKRIETLFSCMYDDCTCGMELPIFGVRFKDGTVAIVKYQESTPFAKLDDAAKISISREIYLTMDERGQFYENGKLVLYSEVKARVSFICDPASEANNDMGPWLGINIPLTSKASDASLATRLKELQTISKAAGRSFNVLKL